MKKVLLFLLMFAIAGAVFTGLRYGGGDTYPDLTTQPLFGEDRLEHVLSYSEPIGDVAVSASGRIFFTVHPDSRSQGNKLLEYVDGASVPYPSLSQQTELFDTPLAIVVDGEDRLWIVDHGSHGMHAAFIMAIDLSSGEVLRRQQLDTSIAPVGSCLQNVAVSPDGRTVFIADSSFWRKSPAIVVYDVASGQAWRVLNGDAAVSAEHYALSYDGREVSFLGGLVALRSGVNGVAAAGDWLYFGAMTGAGLYRVALEALTDESLTDEQLAARVQRVGDKPMSAGLAADPAGQIWIADVEHNAISMHRLDRGLSTALRSSRIRWPTGLTVARNGSVYVSDSALPKIILQPAQQIRSMGPYSLFRFNPDATGAPEQQKERK